MRVISNCTVSRKCSNGAVLQRQQALSRARKVQAGAGSFEALNGVMRSAERTAGRIGDRVKESWKDVDSRYRVSNRLKHYRDDIQRMLPHWRRRFREFSRSRVGRASLWGVFIYSIISGFLFRVLSIMFLLWWVVPLVLVPFMRRSIAKAQENGYGAQGRAAGFGSGASRGNTGYGASRQNQDRGQVIDAEWSSLDSDDSRRRR